MVKKRIGAMLLAMIIGLGGTTVIASNQYTDNENHKSYEMASEYKDTYTININSNVMDYKIYYEYRPGVYTEFDKNSVSVGKTSESTRLTVRNNNGDRAFNYWILISTENYLYSYKFSFGDSQNTVTLKEDSKNIKVQPYDKNINKELQLDKIYYIYKTTDEYVETVELPKVGLNTKIMPGKYEVFASCIKDKNAYILKTTSNISKENTKIEFDTSELMELRIADDKKNNLKIEAMSMYSSNDKLENKDAYQIDKEIESFDKIFVQKNQDTLNIYGDIKISDKNNWKYIYSLGHISKIKDNNKEKIRYLLLNTNIAYSRPMVGNAVQNTYIIYINVIDEYGNDLEMILDENNKEIILNRRLYDENNNDVGSKTKDKRYIYSSIVNSDKLEGSGKCVTIELKFDRDNLNLPSLKRMIYLGKSEEYSTDIEEIKVNGKEILRYNSYTRDSYIYTDINLNGAVIDVKLKNEKAKYTVEIQDISQRGSTFKKAVITVTSANGKVTNKHYIISSFKSKSL